MDHLLREHAPVTEEGWTLLDSEARERLSTNLGARKLVDFSGPHGWSYSASNLGRTDPVMAAPAEGIDSRLRRVLPVVEMRANFTVSREELLSNERGAADADLADLDDAAKQMATAENVAVFHGWGEAGITGIAEASPYPAVPRVKDFNDYPRRVAKAVATLRTSGIDAPYGLALGPADYTSVIETAENGGYPLFEHLRRILGGPIVWAPGVVGAVVLSLRGGDFLFESGQDFAVGYDHHDRDAVHLYIEQTCSFRVATPEAAIALAAK